jgi:hypothetical protein
MVAETWLQPNRRALCLGCIPALAIAIAGAWLALGREESSSRAWLWVGVILMCLGGGLSWMLIRELRRPRIAFQDGAVLFYLRSGPPIAVPVEIVEAFFLGQGPATLPAGLAKNEQTVNLVARLSQKSTQWSRQEVKPVLANWCNGYVTIRGAWCEPLGNELIRRLNRRLKEVQIAKNTTSSE